ncbi:MAG: 3-deoxy-7-phosphoheptulonate synthase [Gemmatimonadota bacterium]
MPGLREIAGAFLFFHHNSVSRMILFVKHDVTDLELSRLRDTLALRGVETYVARRPHRVVVGCTGDDVAMRAEWLRSLPSVLAVAPWQQPFLLTAWTFATSDRTSIVNIGANASVGGSAITVIAGPCSVEGEEMLLDVGVAVRDAGATALRGGAFKPRTSPYAFKGLGTTALELLCEARTKTGLPVVSEVLDPRQVELVSRYADVLQIGARNMQNYSLLAEVGRAPKPVLLKRGLSATVSELLLAAEHVMAQGNHNVILCERGIRTFETATRNTLDVSAIPVLKEQSHLPVIVDPSHAGGRASLVIPLALAAIAAGADGLIVEVHPSPELARSDGEQSLRPSQFTALMRRLAPVAEAVGRTVRHPRPLPPPRAASTCDVS